MEDTRTAEEIQKDKELTDKMYAEIAKAEKEEHEANMKLLSENGIPNEALKNLLDGCGLNGKLEIVNEPAGTDQDESDEFFKQIFVEQRTTGMDGDSFAGFIYGNFGKDKWLKVPYYC